MPHTPSHRPAATGAAVAASQYAVRDTPIQKHVSQDNSADELVAACATRVNEAVANLISACQLRGTAQSDPALKIMGFLASDVEAYPALAFHLAERRSVTVVGGPVSVHPDYCVATAPRNKLAKRLWCSIEALV